MPEATFGHKLAQIQQILRLPQGKYLGRLSEYMTNFAFFLKREAKYELILEGGCWAGDDFKGGT